jgi:hypothetical protein
VVGFTPRPLYPQRKSPRYPLDRRLGEPQSRSGLRQKLCMHILSPMLATGPAHLILLDSVTLIMFDDRYAIANVQCLDKCVLLFNNTAIGLPSVPPSNVRPSLHHFTGAPRPHPPSRPLLWSMVPASTAPSFSQQPPVSAARVRCVVSVTVL